MMDLSCPVSKYLMHLIIFDIDGTLIHSFDDDIFITSVEDYFGISIENRDWTTYPHVTDWGVIEKTFQDKMGKSVTSDELKAVEGYYGEQLETFLDQNPGSVIPMKGCRKFIEQLSDKGHAIGVATGGFYLSAKMKLEAAGLMDLFPAIASSTDHLSRTSILELAADRAREHYRQKEFESITYFGDAIWDYQTTTQLGWNFVGMGTGIKKLALAGADRLFPDYCGRDEDYLKAIKS